MSRMWPFWWFVPVTQLLTEVRVFDMRLIGVGFIEGALVEIIQNSTVIKSGYTDANGKYTTVLGAGTYRIRVSKTGYQTIEKTETLQYPGEILVNLPIQVPITQRSGAAFLYATGEVGNPAIQSVLAVFAEPLMKTPITSTLYILSAEPTSEAITQTTVYQVSVA